MSHAMVAWWLWLLVASLGGGPRDAVARAPVEWRTLDVDRDGDFDRDDLGLIFADGPLSPSVDVTGDGRKDMADTWALPLLLTEWDVHADGRVDALDAAPAVPLVLPTPDSAAAAQLVARVSEEVSRQVPAGLDGRLRGEWTNALGTTTVEERSALYEQAGAGALLARNLEEAQWAFARAASLAPGRPSALAGVAFTLLQQDREAEALVLYARAHELMPEACAVLASIGSVYSRHGLQQEAEAYHRQAVDHCPSVPQYHLNLGASLLRLGRRAEATASFSRALSLNPADGEALVSATGVDPQRAEEAPDLEGEWEALRAEYAVSTPEAAAGMDPWPTLPANQKIDFILSLAVKPIELEYPNAQKRLAEVYTDRIDGAGKAALPEFGDACEDLERWSTRFVPTLEQISLLIQQGRQASFDLSTTYKRRMAAAQIARDRDILQVALTQAQADMVSAGGGPGSRRVFEATIDQLYGETMRRLTWELAHARGFPDLSARELDANNTFSAVALAYIPIVSASVTIPGYMKKDAKCNPKAAGEGAGDVSVGLQAGIAGIEYKPKDCEVKIQVGAGVLVAGTWTPNKGFGFQYGKGYELGVGYLKAGSVHWSKLGSDGSMSEELEGTFGTDFGGWQRSVERQIYPAENEPVGSWPWMANALGCGGDDKGEARP